MDVPVTVIRIPPMGTEPEVLTGEPLYAELEGVTVYLLLSPADRALFDNLPHRSRKVVIVRNLLTGFLVRVKRAPCGAGCYCAAAIVPGA